MSAPETFEWPVAAPFIETRQVGVEDLDHYNHVNNVRYIAWVEALAWEHSNALGVTFDDYKALGVGVVVWRHEFDYVAPLLEGDDVAVATWIINNDGRVRLKRGYEIRRRDTGAVCFRGTTMFVTVDMKTGKPARMPKLFVERYRPAVSTQS